MSEPITDWGTLYSADGSTLGGGTALRAASQDEWNASALSTCPVFTNTPTPPGAILVDGGRVAYVYGGPDMSTAPL